MITVSPNNAREVVYQGRPGSSVFGSEFFKSGSSDSIVLCWNQQGEISAKVATTLGNGKIQSFFAEWIRGIPQNIRSRSDLLSPFLEDTYVTLLPNRDRTAFGVHVYPRLRGGMHSGQIALAARSSADDTQYEGALSDLMTHLQSLTNPLLEEGVINFLEVVTSRTIHPENGFIVSEPNFREDVIVQLKNVNIALIRAFNFLSTTGVNELINRFKSDLTNRLAQAKTNNNHKKRGLWNDLNIFNGHCQKSNNVLMLISIVF